MIRQIARREVRIRLRSRWFRFGALLMLIAPVALGLVQRAASDAATNHFTIAVTPSVATAELAAQGQRAGVQLTTKVVAAPATDEQSIRTLLTANHADVYFDATTRTLVATEAIDDRVRAAVQLFVTQRGLASVGLTDAQKAAIAALPAVSVRTIGRKGSGDQLQEFVAVASGVVLMLLIQLFGGTIGTSVVEEKSTAVAEVLLGRVRPSQLLVGKTVGATLAATMHMAALLAGTVVALLIVNVGVPGSVWGAIASVAVWFVGGFLLYTALYALAGSLASRMEDAQAAMAPITFIVLIGYGLAFAVAGVPDMWWTKALAVIPFLAPFLMPGLIAAGTAPWWLVALALLLMPLTIWAVLRLGGNIYGATLLRRGTRIRFTDIVGLRREGTAQTKAAHTR